MNIVFYIAAAVAVAATFRVLTSFNAVHALLYLIVSLLSVALIFFTLGAPFVAALEVIIYAGAIMVLFIFVIMILNLGPQAAGRERRWLTPGVWPGPAALSLILLGELFYIMISGNGGALSGSGVVGVKEVGTTLFGPYLLGVELASVLLLAGLIGAFHLGRRGESPGREAAGGAGMEGET